MASPNADRVESFISSIDGYEPKLLASMEDAFRIFARFVSRSIDSRYLERHPPEELLPDLEQLMHTSVVRPGHDVVTTLKIFDEPNRRAVLMTCMPDQRFIYSIVRLGLEQIGLKSYRSVNSVMPIGRDHDGRLISVGGNEAPRESFIFIEVDGEDLHKRRQEVEDYLRGRLMAVRYVIQDFSNILTLVRGLASRFETLSHKRPDHAKAYEDSARLLRWLLNEHFVFLGARFLPATGVKAGQLPPSLGIGKLEDWRGMHIEPPEQDVSEAGETPPFMWIRKSRSESWIYRTGRTDHLLVQAYADDGTNLGLCVIEGLFSFPALSEPRVAVPLLDRMVEELYAKLKAVKGSHRYRTIRNAFNSLPLEYLFALPQDDVRKLVEQVLEVETDHRLQVHISCEEQQNIAFIFVALPRSHYSDELRSDIRRLLKERFFASSIDDGVYAGNFESVTFHFFLTGMTQPSKENELALKAEIEQLASPWVERLHDALLARNGKAKARQLAATYSEALPARYREETSIARATEDIAVLEGLGDDWHFDCDIYREKSDHPLEVTRLRMFLAQSLNLSDILPILDNFGLTVIDQFPVALRLHKVGPRVINTFRISGVQGMSCDLTTRRVRLRRAINAVVRGAMSNDSLNRLLLRADIPWPSVVLVLAYVSYARQAGLPYGQATVQEALLRHADVVRSLTELFRTKFDPELSDGANEATTQKTAEENKSAPDERRMQLLERTRRAVLLQLEAVDDLVSDQVLRTVYNLIEATVRTNFYARDPETTHHLVLKFDPSLITRLPEPRPYREIFVYHPEVAGLHLRGGPVARGGIRFSDRLLDFRTEVLGLMATQNLKNVLIVPRGAKGAFVLRNPPSDLSLRRQHADSMYKIFIGGLLDVTDNLVHGEPVTPKNVLCYDAPDHYLVVAADKGTAHLSDTANQLALARGFWLGDAFASGGSQGYDHKKEAITSRGAWACVRRHFREANQDPELDKIRVVGIGDMSGDVFGNGMLRSKSMQLVAAFDHRNIFIDPNPDPATSYEARHKLFVTPRTSWEDYPKELISQGGGIWPRGAKNVTLSAQAQAALGITEASLSAPELVQAILRAPVDLLWNGGIGTYIKAQVETHLDVGDPASDAVRVDATEVRAKVIGEGGNLGITAAGRVELASRGVRLNADAVDNSAGVDMSDHEVNLKILFQRAHERTPLAPSHEAAQAERDRLMETLREQVGEHVVNNNWVQSRMLSLDALRSKRDSARFQRAVAFLADRVPFKRRDANLPGERITRMRSQKGEGLYHPELAVIAANAKLDMRQELSRAAHRFPLDSLKVYLQSYFAQSLHQRFGEDILKHPLAINIARMMLVNSVVGDAGASWLPEMSLMSGRATADILHAYFDANALLKAPALKLQTDQMEGGLPAGLEYRLRLRIEDALEEVSIWLLRQLNPVDETFIKVFPEALQAVNETLGLQDELHDALVAQHAPIELTEHVAILARVDDALDIALLAAKTQTPAQHVAQNFYSIGERTGIYALVQDAMQGQSQDDLDRPARFALRHQLRTGLMALVTSHLKVNTDDGAGQASRLAAFDSLAKDLAPLNIGERPLCNLVVAQELVTRALIS